MGENNTILRIKRCTSVSGVRTAEREFLFPCFGSVYMKFRLLTLTMSVHCLGCRYRLNQLALLQNLVWESIPCFLDRLFSPYGWYWCWLQSTSLELVQEFTAVVFLSQLLCAQSFRIFVTNLSLLISPLIPNAVSQANVLFLQKN